MNEVSKICYVMACGAFIAPLTNCIINSPANTKSLVEWGVFILALGYGVLFTVFEGPKPKNRK